MSLTLAAISPARADDNLRCGGRLVSVGMNRGEVKALCGTPKEVRTETVPVYVKTAAGGVVQTGTTTMEYWTYDRGNSRFPARLKFDDSKLVGIELLRPGEHKPAAAGDGERQQEG